MADISAEAVDASHPGDIVDWNEGVPVGRVTFTGRLLHACHADDMWTAQVAPETLMAVWELAPRLYRPGWLELLHRGGSVRGLDGGSAPLFMPHCDFDWLRDSGAVEASAACRCRGARSDIRWATTFGAPVK